MSPSDLSKDFLAISFSLPLLNWIKEIFNYCSLLPFVKSVFRGRMTHRVTEHQTRTLSYDVTSALKRTFILRPFLSLCFVRFRHFENKAAEVERHKEKTHSHSPRKHLIANRKFVIFSRWKIPSEIQLISRKHKVQVCFLHAISISRTPNVKDVNISGKQEF